MSEPKATGEAEVVPSTSTRRLPYEKPVLRRLGSVNKMTLSQSGGTMTDGSKTIKVSG